MTTFEHVRLGDYTLYLVREHPDQTGMEPGMIRNQAIGGPVNVTVESGELANVRIGP